MQHYVRTYELLTRRERTKGMLAVREDRTGVDCIDGRGFETYATRSQAASILKYWRHYARLNNGSIDRIG